MFSFALSVVLSSVQHAITAWIPFADDSSAQWPCTGDPGVALFGTIYACSTALTPARYAEGGAESGPARC
jgi:hypothetical protein